MKIDRRGVLGLGLYSAAWVCWPRAARGARAARSAPEAIEELVQWILAAPREEALRRGARELHAGLDPQLLLGALLVGSTRAIHPRNTSINHASFVVASLDQLTRGASALQQARNTLWGLEFMKQSQEYDEAELGHWEWSVPDAQKLPEGERALAALVVALDNSDHDAADLALVGAVRSAPAARLDALLAEYGARTRTFIGHRAICAAQLRRALPLAGPAQREGVLRALVGGGLGSTKSSDNETFEASRKFAAEAPAPKAVAPRDDAGPARELLAEIRKGAGAELPLVVARLLAQGAHPDALWDAIFVAASESMLGRPGKGQLHAFTSAEALQQLGRSTHQDRVARIALMQASAWVTRFRATLKKDLPAGETGFQVETLEPLEEGESGFFAGAQMERVRRAFAAGAGAESAERWRAGALQLVRAKADDVHEFKLAAAALGVSRTVGAFARPAVLAALALHLPDPARPDGERLLRIDKAIADAR